MGNIKFEKLLEPIQIGTMKLKNRFVMAPMVTNYCTKDGAVTEKFKAYHQTRARGGVGLIIIEAIYVSQAAKGFSNEVGIHKDELIPGLRELTEAVHKDGAKIAAQLYHAGRQTHQAVSGTCLVAPSPIPCPVGQEVPKELKLEEIEGIIEDFGQAARRAMEAGFDAVEIHGAHGYLLNQFLSPYSNKRTDEYGGSFENRAKFPLRVVNKVRAVVGKDFPVTYRMSSEEFVAGGLTVEDTKEFAKKLVEAGIDAIHISGGVYESAAMIIQPAAVPQGCYVANADAIKKAIGGKVPIIVVGRIKDPVAAEEILRTGKADLVAMGRALLADPELPNKVAQGRYDDIRKCIACNQGCIDRLFQDIDIACLVNAMTGHELEYDFKKPAKKKKLLVIGAGPGGLEAARVAAIRGHEVVLTEKNNELGGQMLIASVPPYKEEINDFTKFLTEAVEKLGVKIFKGKATDEASIKEIKPDAIILATGAETIIPNIPGVKLGLVVTGHDVLKKKATVGKKAVVIGGGAVGCEVAEYLALQGKEVTIIEMLDGLALDDGLLVRALLLNRIAAENIQVLTKSKVLEIFADGLAYEKDGKVQKLIGVDTIVLAVGAKSKDSLADMLSKTGVPFVKIGDCVKPRKIIDAIQEGFREAFNL